MTSPFCRARVPMLFCALLLSVSVANSQDALRGKTLYRTTNGAPIPCADAACHDIDPTKDKSGILKGANNAPLIHAAIVSKVAQMKFLTAYVSAQDELDMAAYIANPNVAATPSIAVAPASLTFASTYVGSASAVASVTVSNSGTANLVLSSLSLSGTNAAEFRVESTSTCTGGSTLVPGASCRVNLTFRPTSTGAKAANLALAHNAAAGTTLVPVSGTASPAPAPSITVSPAAITFPSTTAGGSSAVYSVTAANTGTAALIFSAISTSGVNANDFKIEPTSTCSISASIAPGGSCRADLTFKPTVLGALTASLLLAHNAPSGTSSVALNGTATAAPTPTIALSASSLSFGPQEVGSQSALQTITVTNVGSAALNISALTAGGSHVTDFPRSGTCLSGMTLAATGGNCTLVFAFAPTAVGMRTSNLTIASNNSGGNRHRHAEWQRHDQRSGRFRQPCFADLRYSADRHQQCLATSHDQQYRGRAPVHRFARLLDDALLPERKLCRCQPGGGPVMHRERRVLSEREWLTHIDSEHQSRGGRQSAQHCADRYRQHAARARCASFAEFSSLSGCHGRGPAVGHSEHHQSAVPDRVA